MRSIIGTLLIKYKPPLLSLIFALYCFHNMKIELTAFKELTGFPSGSGIEFYDNKIYLAGDDAKDILVMSRKWKQRTLIHLFDNDEERIPKKEKADLEATTIVSINKKANLLLLGSGSTEQRNKAVLLSLQTNEKTEIDLSVFYQRIKAAGVEALNIEGAATVGGYIVLSNRGNKSNKCNQLIITGNEFWKKQDEAAFQLVKLDMEDAPEDMCVSGITYSEKHEMLLLTTSTEDTDNAIDDGKIGASGIAFIENFYRKIGREKGKMKINRLVDLSTADKKFRGFKIESVCIQSEKDRSLKVHLAADNDTGKTYLFKAVIKL
ncbi:DUF6929 family protein [Foetidibacter luteolus]|uniref:DUF6929 family protein n=1 Tax=Foetidibacter luteolus TaxID=2608880 RepID=UPI00129BEEC3|nr:hypothetical protein [Foetidibacter luteolus]